MEKDLERIKQINAKIAAVEDSLIKINKKIKLHPDTEPDFYEIANSWIRFGELVHEKCLYYNQVGYPVNLQTDKPCTCYNIVRLDPHLYLCYMKVREMEKLRKIPSHPLLEDQDIKELYSQEIIYASITGYMSYRNEYKELLCKCMSVPFLIYQETRKNPNYQYDNQEEFLEMKMTLDEMPFEEDDQRRVLIGSILNKIYQRSTWYHPENGEIYQTEGQKGRQTTARK